jgi:hypothetical protein
VSTAGRWRIVEMDLWDHQALDLVAPATIEFGRDHIGSFRFVAVEAWMDCRRVLRDGRPAVEFSWEGSDDGDPASGRGWAAVEDGGSLVGHIWFHMGDDSGFRAVRVEGPRRVRPAPCQRPLGACASGRPKSTRDRRIR